MKTGAALFAGVLLFAQAASAADCRGYYHCPDELKPRSVITNSPYADTRGRRYEEAWRPYGDPSRSPYASRRKPEDQVKLKPLAMEPWKSAYGQGANAYNVQKRPVTTARVLDAAVAPKVKKCGEQKEQSAGASNYGGGDSGIDGYGGAETCD